MANSFSEADLARLRSAPEAGAVPGLVDEVSRLYLLSRDERVKRAERFIDRLLADVNSYHDHKETMAHAGLLVMIAVVGGIASLETWPPKWMSALKLYLDPHTIGIVAAVSFWVILHLYIRWQLRQRRWAAIAYNGAVRAAAQWLLRDPIVDDLVPCPSKSPSLGSRLLTAVDFLVPCPWAPLQDVWSEYCPSWLAAAVQAERGGSALGAVKAECLVTLGSYFLLAVILARTL